MPPYQTYRARVKENISTTDSALVAIYNKTGSGKVIDIRRVLMHNVTCGTANTIGIEALRKISAVTGGEDLEVAKLDSSSGDLPTQVKVVANPVSITSGNLMARNACYTTFGGARLPLVFQMLGGSRRCSGLIRGFHMDDTQGIVLREGQGVAWVLDTMVQSSFYRISCVFTTTDAGYPTYVTDCEYNFNMDNHPMFALFNGSGSGKVIVIRQFMAGENGDDTYPGFVLIPIRGINENTGEQLIVEKMDSLNLDVPSSIVLKSDCIIETKGNESPIITDVFAAGASGTRKYFWDRMFTGPRIRTLKQIYWGRGGITNVNFEGSAGEYSRPFEGVFTLREGEGLALMQMNLDSATLTEYKYKSSRFNYNVGMLFTMREAQVPGFVGV